MLPPGYCWIFNLIPLHRVSVRHEIVLNSWNSGMNLSGSLLKFSFEFLPVVVTLLASTLTAPAARFHFGRGTREASISVTFSLYNLFTQRSPKQQASNATSISGLIHPPITIQLNAEAGSMTKKGASSMRLRAASQRCPAPPSNAIRLRAISSSLRATKFGTGFWYRRRVPLVRNIEVTGKGKLKGFQHAGIGA